MESSVEPTITVKQVDKKGMEFEGRKEHVRGLTADAVLRPGGLRYEGEPG